MRVREFRRKDLPQAIEEAVRTLVTHTQGRFFYVEFVKKDDTLRPMVARVGVTKGVLGTGTNHAKKYGYITVWDTQKREFRNINPGTVRMIRFQGTEVVFQ